MGLCLCLFLQFTRFNKAEFESQRSTDSSQLHNTTRQALWVFVPLVPDCPVMTGYYGNHEMSRSSVVPDAGSAFPRCHLPCKTNVRTRIWRGLRRRNQKLIRPNNAIQNEESVSGTDCEGGDSVHSCGLCRSPRGSCCGQTLFHHDTRTTEAN